jgi:hypothetical protein
MSDSVNQRVLSGCEMGGGMLLQALGSEIGLDICAELSHLSSELRLEGL